MNRKLLLGIFLLCILIFAVSSVSAITFENKYFALNGSGSFMAHPPVFTGQIIGGPLYPGTFWMIFYDTGWPTDDPGTPQNERLDYIIAHYFRYDSKAGAECWTGYFPPTGTSEPRPDWRFFTAAGDTVGGGCSQVLMTIRDSNANGIMEETEYAHKVISGTMAIYIVYGKGCFHNLCGSGSFNGNLNVVNAGTMEEELYVPSQALPSGILRLRDGSCSLGVEPSSWGAIKSIYR